MALYSSMKKSNKNKALVLLSGGQDSTTCLAIALQNHPGHVEAIAFSYGQRHKIELECATKIAGIAKVPLKIIEIPKFADLSKNALTDETISIETKKGELPTTFVPGRNALFLTCAAIYAYERAISNIYIGTCETDYSGYPDCRAAFIASMTKSLNLAMDFKFVIHTPLMKLTKAQTVLKMKDLGKLDWYNYTHTCYAGVRPACGRCPACELRLNGFRKAGLDDPLVYV